MNDTTSQIYLSLTPRRAAFLASIRAKIAALDPAHPEYATRLKYLNSLESDLLAIALQSPALTPHRVRGRDV